MVPLNRVNIIIDQFLSRFSSWLLIATSCDNGIYVVAINYWSNYSTKLCLLYTSMLMCVTRKSRWHISHYHPINIFDGDLNNYCSTPSLVNNRNFFHIVVSTTVASVDSSSKHNQGSHWSTSVIYLPQVTLTVEVSTSALPPATSFPHINPKANFDKAIDRHRSPHVTADRSHWDVSSRHRLESWPPTKQWVSCHEFIRFQ